MTARFSAPQPLIADLEVASFNSGVPTLDDWLKRRAGNNETEGASRTFVVAEGKRVVAYYALAAGAVAADDVTGAFRRNMPDPIPVVLLGRLAVDRTMQGLGLGGGLFKDAALRTERAADHIGIRGIVVHAISPEAKAFYLKQGFKESPGDPMLLFVSMRHIRAVLGQAGA
jgi:GNAT superfamily N-acetyltransferase